LRPFFRVLAELTWAIDDQMAEDTGPGSPVDLYDGAVLARANNLLKASRILLAYGYWEVAASATRQLFELLVNMEYLSRQPDREAAYKRYQKFAWLQQANRERRALERQRANGRSVDEEHEAFVQQLLDGPTFEEFRAKDGRWKPSWSGQSTRALAEQSPSKERLQQYDQAFIVWSEQTHGAPVALLDSMTPRPEAGWVERLVAIDDLETSQMIVMLFRLFFELGDTAPGAPQIDVGTRLRWTSELAAAMREQGS